jgi:hypothetical protein
MAGAGMQELKDYKDAGILLAIGFSDFSSRTGPAGR